MDAPRALAQSVVPGCAIEGGRITLVGEGLPYRPDRAPAIRVGGIEAAVVSASTRRLNLIMPSGVEPGRTAITAAGMAGPLGFVEVAGTLASDLHQVDNPAVDTQGNVYATFSGTRGQQVPTSVFRVRPDGARDPLASGIVNATSLAFDRDGDLCVTSRFDGSVYRIGRGGRIEKIASDLGVACGIAFLPDGSYYVGDRGGTLFRVNAAGRVIPFASLPPSVAAFHLAIGPDEAVYISGPTLSSSDTIRRVDRRGEVSVVADGFGRPQGLAFDARGRLHVVEALAGASGLYRISPGGRPELMVSGAGLIGVAFHPDGGFVLASSDTLYRSETDLP